MGLHTPTILGGNSHLSWFYDRGAIKDPAHTGTSKGIARAIKKGPIRIFLPKYANVYVTIQSHALSAVLRHAWLICLSERHHGDRRPVLLVKQSLLLSCHCQGGGGVEGGGTAKTAWVIYVSIPSYFYQ